MKIRPSKKLWWIIAGILVIGATTTYWVTTFLYQSKAPSAPQGPEESTVKPNLPEQPSRKLSFALMGDMLAHDSVVSQAKTTNGYDFTPYFSSVKPLYENSDIVFCNPETPAAGEKFNISGYPTFNAPLEFSRDLSKVGCNLINLASNHIADKGQPAIDATLDEWEQLKPLAVAGANRSVKEQQTVKYFEKNGLRVAFLAFADFSNGPAPSSYSLNLYHDQPLAERLMKEARQNAEVVVVSLHWGTEDSHQVNQDQIGAAKLFNNLGADVIIGTGPHVLQKVEMIKNPRGHQTLTWYSIGNMLSSQLQVDELTGGVAKFTVTLKDDKLEFSDIAFSPTFMSYQWSEADKVAGLLNRRRDLKLQPLNSAAKETALFGLTVAERKQKVQSWLGDQLKIKID